MSTDDEMEMHGTRTVRESGNSVTITLPPDAVEHAGLTVGENAMVCSNDGSVVLLPWSEDDVSAMLSDE